MPRCRGPKYQLYATVATRLRSTVELSPQQIDSLKAAGRFDPYLQAETMRVVTPYLVLGAIVFAWAQGARTG